ncbi:MAG: bifunctional 4-hydroxy-2-oxoglutarate aldolase/2-dehydro-3-deoxy-phosphogluconate aldolase [Planctomycetales bacterium]|nr:bifunctional 4-hydroxy-2-oxoglutarate aldolase/2-dehydro-3-deoxy-phosphogluconate aldolase [Planctomycetales bacterium]
MMTSQFPEQLLAKIERCGVVAVLVLDDADHAVPVANALLEGGIEAIELTLRTPAALAGLQKIRKSVPEILAGIGTVLTTDQVTDIVAAGAQFAVAPGLNPRVVRAAQAANLPFAPGIVTPSDLEAAIELGCREVKFFPAEPSGGLTYLKSIAAPYAHLGIRYIPLGGVSPENLADYLAYPAIAAVGGSWLAPRNIIRDENWGLIRRHASVATEIAKQARNKSQEV